LKAATDERIQSRAGVSLPLAISAEEHGSFVRELRFLQLGEPTLNTGPNTGSVATRAAPGKTCHRFSRLAPVTFAYV
jgi:hypothetical protein